jgi:hypothetical protein
MKYNAPEVILAGSSITAVQGSPGIQLSMKDNSHPDAAPNEGYSVATSAAYEADE